MPSSPPDPQIGRILSVRGSVIDARFPDRLPEVHHQLRTGDDEAIAIEVVSHLDEETRCRLLTVARTAVEPIADDADG